jgi:hypothetical protein
VSAKDEKKKKRAKERLAELEATLVKSLTQKTSAVEINVPEYTRKIQELKQQISKV